MWLRLLVPFTLVWAVLALSVEGTPLRRYRGGAARESLALAFAFVSYFIVWLVLDRLIEVTTRSVAAGLIAASLLSLLAVPALVYLGYRIFRVAPQGGGRGSH